MDSTKLETVKIVMLKGEKGDTGGGSYDDTEVRSLITAEAQERAIGDNALEMTKADKTEINDLATAKADKTTVIAIEARVSTAENDIDVLDARMDTFASLPSGSTSGNAELVDIRVGADGVTYPSAGDAVRGQVSDLIDDLDNIVDNYTILKPYLYKKNTYINASNVETSLNGYDLFKIPINHLDVVRIKWTGSNFWNGISSSYVARFELSNNTYRTGAGAPENVIHESNKEALYLCPSDAINLCIVANADLVDDVSVFKNIQSAKLLPDNIQALNYVTKLSSENSILSNFFLGNNNVIGTFTSPTMSYFVKVKAGDRVTWGSTLTGLSRSGVYRNASGNAVEIPLGNEYTFAEDGLASIYDNPPATGAVTFYPKDSIKIEGKNIVGDVASNNSFDGLNAVAFGTSLTYRSQTTGGFLQYLPALSGMTFDNQGIGSSMILGNMLTAIKNYDSYDDKDICTLEGFCNDWYYNGDNLGTWKDTTESTVCGCVRSALNYILTQNPDITVFLILDHYGQGINATTEVNSDGLTQFEFYEEIAKVAESLGIPVIKEYAISGINEKTPQYLLDNIHPNALGAKQSAYAIWSQMKQYYPNQI